MTASIPVVYLIDDDKSFRTALARVLQAGGHEVRAFPSVADFLLAREHPLRGCILLDVRLPGGPSGLELQQALVRQGETLPIIFLTGHGDISMGVQAMRDGAFDFLTKPVQRETLLKAVRCAMEREEETWRASQQKRDVSVRAANLTRAELAVFHAVVEGRPNKQIAATLNCSERTVKSHRARVMAKMGASSLADLVKLSALVKRAEP